MSKLKEKLGRRELCLGTHISLTESCVTEMIGNLPYDYLWIDMEHTTIHNEHLLQHLIAARASGISAIVRIPWNDAALAKPVLDMGTDGIVFPMVRNYEEAKAAMMACMYPPKGVRGYGPRRATRFGLMDRYAYQETVDDTLARFIQIEHIDAVNDLDRILTIDEIDAYILGPNDLSGSLGKLGHINDPQVRAVIDTAIEKITAAGKVVGLSLGAADETALRDWSRRGVRMISVGFDTAYIMAGATANLEAMRRAFSVEA